MRKLFVLLLTVVASMQLSAQKNIDSLKYFIANKSTEQMWKFADRADSFLSQQKNILAKQNYDMAWAICSKITDTMSVDRVRLLSGYSRYYTNVSNYTKLQSTLSDAMRILEHNGMTDSVQYADCLNSLSIIYGSHGDFKRQQQLVEKALDIYGRRIGRLTPQYAAALENLSSVYQNTGDYLKMRECIEDEMRICSELYGENSIPYADALTSFGNSYALSGDSAKEFDCYRKALDINDTKTGDGALETARLSLNLSKAYSESGNFKEQLNYATKASEIYIAKTGLNSVKSADCRVQMGYANSMLGHNVVADAFFKRAEDIYKKQLGDQSPKLAECYYNLGKSLSNRKMYLLALPDIFQSVDIMRQNLVSNFSFMTTELRNKYWEDVSKYFEQSVRLCFQCPEKDKVNAYAYNSALISKGIKLSSELEFSNIIRNSNDNTLITKFEQLQTIRQQINDELEVPLTERTVNTDSLSKIADNLESQLVNDCQEYGDMTRPIKLVWTDIRNSLRDKDIAIEFVRTAFDADTVYGALLIGKGMASPAFQKLFTQRQYDTTYHSQYKPYTDTRLYEMVWKPLSQYFTDSCNIYFAPDGLIYNVAIEYAPISDNEIFSDKYHVYRISSTRNLALNRQHNQIKNAVIYGGIDYNCDTVTLKTNSRNLRNINRGASALSFSASVKGDQKFQVDYLQGTKAEADNIDKSLSNNNVKTTYYSGNKALEESFKLLSGKTNDIIHIATHGFYLKSSVPLEGDNALLQSGLLFAGCNYTLMDKPIPNGIDDGILTAREISFLDLRNTDLVVMSACETGLGEVTSDGVYGLQRGFKKSGVNTLVMSLWPVNDYATKLLMTSFYRNLTSGMTKRSAFETAQKSLRAKSGVTPMHWAAFIMLDGEE